MVAVDKPKENPQERTPLEDEEVTRLLDACDDRTRPIAVLAVYLGLRKGEIEALRWGDFSEADRMLAIKRPKVRNAARLFLGDGPLEALQRLRRSLGRIPKATDYLFSSKSGTMNIRRRWATMLERAGLAEKKIGLHHLRHTCAVRLLESGATLVQVMHVLGHTNVATTQIYLDHVRTSGMNEALAGLDFSAQKRSERPLSAQVGNSG